MSGQKTSSGTWVVLSLVAMGVIGGLAGLKFRQMPPRDEKPPSTQAITK